MPHKFHTSSIDASLQDQSILTTTARASLPRHRSMQYTSTRMALDKRCSIPSHMRMVGLRSTPPWALHLGPPAVRQAARMVLVCAYMNW